MRIAAVNPKVELLAAAPFFRSAFGFTRLLPALCGALPFAARSCIPQMHVSLESLRYWNVGGCQVAVKKRANLNPFGLIVHGQL